MQHLEGSGTPVHYIGRTVLKLCISPPLNAHISHTVSFSEVLLTGILSALITFPYAANIQSHSIFLHLTILKTFYKMYR
jgi:hypothetical protein